MELRDFENAEHLIRETLKLLRRSAEMTHLLSENDQGRLETDLSRILLTVRFGR